MRLASVVIGWIVVLVAVSSAKAETILAGAGGVFPKPIYDRMIAEYSKIRPEVKINYSSVGSGAGIKKLCEGLVDFAGTDSPLKDDQMRLFEEVDGVQGKILHIPTVIGAVVVINHSGVSSEQLRFSPETLADVMLGKIRKWDDPRLKELNPSLVGDQPITVVHRSDSSGTTAIYTGYLSQVSEVWKQCVGAGTSVKWPAANTVGGKGGDSPVSTLRQLPGAVGYVEWIYAKANGLPSALIRNRAGEYVAVSIDTITAAADQQWPDDLRISLVDAPGKNAYPICGATWIVVRQKMKDPAKQKALAEFLWWVTHEGQRYAAPMYYAPLPNSVVKQAEPILQGMAGADVKLGSVRTGAAHSEAQSFHQ